MELGIYLTINEKQYEDKIIDYDDYVAMHGRRSAGRYGGYGGQY